MSKLTEYNAALERRLQAWIRSHVRDHAARRLPDLGEYPLVRWKRLVGAVVSAALECEVVPSFDLIDRSKFGGDLAVKFPALLAQGGPKAFIATYLGRIVEALKGPTLAPSITGIVTKGMYINLTLSDEWLIETARFTSAFGAEYGRSTALADKVLVVDYSSPNVAKSLHAGHIRSTIIGHVLCNVAEAAGALVYRVNHINDFGGFGFILEGWRRFGAGFPEGMEPHVKLIELYRIRRTLERAVKDVEPRGPLDPPEVALVLKIAEIPEKVAAAATQLNPTLLLRHLHETASQYNTYYAKSRVIDNGVANSNRLAITKAVSEALTRGLAICHVGCPERI